MDILLPAVLAFLAVVFVALQVHAYTRLSPIDELQHIDSLYRAPAAPAPGDRVGQQAMRQQDCRGVDAPGFEPGPCRPLGSFDPATYQEKGYNTAAANTPLYYTATRGVAEVIQAVTPADDLVTAGRLAGGVWLGLGLVLTYVAGRRRGVGRGPMLVVGALLVAAPGLQFPGGTITPDAWGLLVGAVLLLALTWWEERPTKARTAVLVGAAVIVGLVKLTNLVGVAAIAFYLLLGRDRDEVGGPGRARRAVTGVVTGGAAVLAAGAWLVVVSSRPQMNPDDLPDMVTRFQTPVFPWSGLLDNALVLVQPLAAPVPVGTLNLTVMATSIVSLVLVSGTVAAGVFGAAPERSTTLARAVLLAAVVGALALVVMGYVFSGSYFPLPPRYGMALLAPMAVVTAACVRGRTSLAVAGAVAAVAVAVSAVRLLQLL
ncbi:hypothetical protein IEZ26_18675 [Nocardioides cavernae]|uniref:Glycosyltransferase RgtA/B/C/D-like domain-containing protein n=1 Tax=Nocardioides cavernae TaxID=1921566 RepID=A0ABR8NFK1_9ACTN|nr:hypothetical protein [Nocardioides cavernae]MBD3926650.1 hypothetical protein [Nocardioides cavernae]MBM7512372.1 hypothetical protein [Nocardioides cavernae]